METYDYLEEVKKDIMKAVEADKHDISDLDFESIKNYLTFLAVHMHVDDARRIRSSDGIDEHNHIYLSCDKNGTPNSHLLLDALENQMSDIDYAVDKFEPIVEYLHKIVTDAREGELAIRNYVQDVAVSDVAAMLCDRMGKPRPEHLLPERE